MPETPAVAMRGRRRGEALRAAIHDAVMAELAENGYAQLTMERVADRAGAGKASLYRRWSSRAELVRDTAYHLLRDPDGLPDTGSLRGDLVAALGQTAALLAGPIGAALRALVSEALADRVDAAELASLSTGMGRRIVAEVIGRAVERGEIPPDAGGGLRLDVGQALLRDRFLFRGTAPDDALVAEIVDDVLLPLFGAADPPAAE